MTAKKKNFTTPTDAFITKPEEKQEAKRTRPIKVKVEDFEVPAGYKLVKESRSARLQLLVTPTLAEDIKTAAKVNGVSINEMCSRMFEEYLKKGEAEE